MHNNKKASAQAGQKLNHVHYSQFIGAPQANGLTPVYQGWHDPYVPETEGNGFSSPKDKGGRSALTADFLRPSHVLPRLWRAVWGSLRACRFLCPGLLTPHAPATHLAVGSGNDTADKGVHAMRLTASGKPAHIFKPRTPGNSRFSLRLDVYRAFRLVSGPVLAHRVAFGFKGLCHG